MHAMSPIRLILTTLLLAMASCSSSRPMSVMVEVADANTKEPVEGVIIRAAGGTFYVPTMEASIIGGPGTTFGPPPNPTAAIGRTNEQGTSYMTVAGQRPVFMRFFKEGYPVGFLVIETGETQALGASDWTTERTLRSIDASLVPDGDQTPDLELSELMYRISAVTPQDDGVRN